MQSDYLTKAISGSEDCLYLNVYVPKSAKANAKKPLPVLVFIHGGSFKVFSADPGLFGPDYLMDTEEVIVVTIQYRLGVFGFLASGDKSSMGNFGLKDQQMALQWIYKNIRHFGGDPKKITLSGQSSGAASVQYQMVSRGSNGLFQKAILMSGSMFSFWTRTKDPESQFRYYAAIANIPRSGSEPTEKIVKILKEKSAEDLINYQNEMYIYHTIIATFRPVVEGNWDGAFISEDPEYIWESCRYQQRPFLIGVTGYEPGAYADEYSNITLRQQFLSNPEYNLAIASEYSLPSIQPIIDHYFNGNPSEENAEQFLNYFGAISMTYPLYKTTVQYTQCGNVKKRPVDIYLFNFTSDFTLSFLTNPFPLGGKGASHADDLLYLFRFKRFDPIFRRRRPENEMKDYFVRYIVDYMKHGIKYSDDYHRCSIEFTENGFCNYLDIQRTNDKVDVKVSEDYDLALDVLREADRIQSQLEDPSVP